MLRLGTWRSCFRVEKGLDCHKQSQRRGGVRWRPPIISDIPQEAVCNQVSSVLDLTKWPPRPGKGAVEGESAGRQSSAYITSSGLVFQSSFLGRSRAAQGEDLISGD